MFSGNSPFAKTLKISQMILGATSRRHDLIANNLANVDTPGYKRKSLRFEAELKRSLQNEKELVLPLRITDERHFSGTSQKKYNSVEAKVWEEVDTNYKNDKNNVDGEAEMSNLVKNYFHNSGIINSVNAQFRRLKSVIV